ncbi:hypothetical protein [Haloferax larsenii]|uniref:hypothetical protein n=1 Tax=Haloferax larsenii TaxID=302484 RepID=UPI0011135068|nr:hypothetical protein [Haloferax larsenii]
MTTRRQFLAAVSSASVLMSGCTQDQDTSLEIGILNSTTQPHSVELRLQSDTETKFSQQARVSAAETSTTSSKIETSVSFDDISVSDEYLFSVKVDGYDSQSLPVNVDCTVDDGGDQFGVKITGHDLILTDKQC